MNNVVKLVLDNKVYNLEAVLSACYSFIDRAYMFLDTDSKKAKTLVSLKGKKKISPKKLNQLKDEFLNELLYCSLRYTVSKNNKKIREYIVGRALYSALPESDLISESEKSDYIEDPLGIAIPWEEKYGKKEKV